MNENFRNKNTDFIDLNVASPIEIREWALKTAPNGQYFGEVLSSSTLDFYSLQPEFGGLFCPRIFGPIHDWKCACGTYNGILLNKICEECGVELTEARVRRYRLGYIDLNTILPHSWYFQMNPNYILLLLKSGYPQLDKKLKTSILYNIIYYRGEKDIQEIKEKLNILNNHLLGGEFIHFLLSKINLKNSIKNIKNELLNKYSTNDTLSIKNLVLKLRILENLYKSRINPSWLCLSTISVLPPTLRPLVQVENNKIISSDINEFYKLIIDRNQFILDQIENNNYTSLLLIHSKKLLQNTLDSLIDNSKQINTKNTKKLKGISEYLEGKFGRFRNTLLGKRVDFSARSVIIVEPKLKLSACGIPFRIAIELFRPFLINFLLNTNIEFNKLSLYNLQKILFSHSKPILWHILKKLLPSTSIFLNRAPTLHRYGIQSFKPILITGKTIKLHPLVCSGFNADFDGDQMAVHLPLYFSSQIEGFNFMDAKKNIFSISNGSPLTKPTQDMILGFNYLSQKDPHKYINYNLILNNILSSKNLHTNLLTYNNNFNIKYLKKINVYNSKKNKNTYLINSNLLYISKKKENTYIIKKNILQTTAGKQIINNIIK